MGVPASSFYNAIASEEDYLSALQQSQATLMAAGMAHHHHQLGVVTSGTNGSLQFQPVTVATSSACDDHMTIMANASGQIYGTMSDMGMHLQQQHQQPYLDLSVS